MCYEYGMWVLHKVEPFLILILFFITNFNFLIHIHWALTSPCDTETFKHCLQCARHFYYDQYLSSGWHLFLSPQSSSWSEHLCSSYQLQLFLCLISSEFLLSLWYHSTPISHAKSPGISHCAPCGFFSAVQHSGQNKISKFQCQLLKVLS